MMTQKFRYRFILLLSLLLTMPQMLDARTLTWKQSLEALRTQNASVKASNATYESVRALELGAESGFYPDLSGSLDYSKTAVEGSSGTLQNDEFYSATLNLDYKLFSGFLDQSKSRQARANSKAAFNQLQMDLADVSQEFISAYAGLIYAQDYLKLTERIMKRRKENLNLVELRFESGRENKGSVLLSRANVKQAEFENHQARHLLEVAIDQLRKVLNVSATENLELSEPIPLNAPPETPPAFEEMAQSHPRLQQAWAQSDSALAGIGVAKSAFWPTLSLSGSIGRSSPEFFPEKDKWSIGVGLKIPLFSGGRDYSQYRNARFISESKTQTTISTDQDLVVKLRQSFNAYSEAVEKLQVDADFKSAAEVRAEVARSQYNNGLTSFVDWDNIENDLINREKNYIQSQRDRTLKESSWTQTQGKGVL